MPFGVDDAMMAASLLSGLGGLFKKRGPDPRQQYLDQLGAELADQQNQLVGNDRRSLYSLAGTGGDAIGALGRRLGSTMAGAGVTNSSATAGALTQAQRDYASQIAGLGQANLQSELANNSANQRYLTGQRLGVANNDVAYNRDQRAGTLSGIAQLLSKIGSDVGAGNGAQGANYGRKIGDAGVGRQGSVLDMSNVNQTDVPYGGYQAPKMKIPKQYSWMNN